MSQPDTIEFYVGDKVISILNSSMIPPVGSYINIEKTTYKVDMVSFAIDYQDKLFERQMRANVQLVKVKP